MINISEHKACLGCDIIKAGLECDASRKISSMASDKGIEAKFQYCVFNRMARKLRLKVLREELGVEADIEYRRKTS